jgi:hypothetical protein
MEMASKVNKSDEIRRAEDLICRLRDIRSCFINTDAHGEISEIHVVAHTDRPPKLVARDVETALRAELGLEVDYKKIGISLMQDDEKNKISPLIIEELEEDIRVRFEGVNLLLSQDAIEAEVELSRNGVHAHGKARGQNTRDRALTLIAEATLSAVADLLPESPPLSLGEVKRVEISRREAIVVCVNMSEGRQQKSLVGSALVESDVNQTVLFATLDALNRLLGRLPGREPRQYEIK